MPLFAKKKIFNYWEGGEQVSCSDDIEFDLKSHLKEI